MKITKLIILGAILAVLSACSSTDEHGVTVQKSFWSDASVQDISKADV